MVDCSPAVEGSSLVPPVRQCAKRVQRDAFVKNVKRYVLKRVASQRNLRDKRHVNDNANHTMSCLLDSTTRFILTISRAKSLQLILISVACSSYSPPPPPPARHPLPRALSQNNLAAPIYTPVWTKALR